MRRRVLAYLRADVRAAREETSAALSRPPSIGPGVDSVTLGDSDAIAHSVLALAPATQVPSAVRPDVTETDLTGVLV
jgi:hypothetical protein